jgi:hypothetical protein
MTSPRFFHAVRTSMLGLAAAVLALGVFAAGDSRAATLDVVYTLDAGATVDINGPLAFGTGTIAAGTLDLTYQGGITTGGNFLGTALTVNNFFLSLSGVSAPLSMIPTSTVGGGLKLDLSGPGSGFAFGSPVVFTVFGSAGVSGIGDFSGFAAGSLGTRPVTGSLAFSGDASSLSVAGVVFPGPLGQSFNYSFLASASTEVRITPDGGGQPVPEPTSVALFGLGALLIGTRLRRVSRRA